jgi:hypothetical protein
MTIQLWSVITASRAAAAFRQLELLCGSTVKQGGCGQKRSYSFIAGIDKGRSFAGTNIQDGL